MRLNRKDCSFFFEEMMKNTNTVGLFWFDEKREVKKNNNQLKKKNKKQKTKLFSLSLSLYFSTVSTRNVIGDFTNKNRKH